MANNLNLNNNPINMPAPLEIVRNISGSRKPSENAINRFYPGVCYNPRNEDLIGLLCLKNDEPGLDFPFIYDFDRPILNINPAEVVANCTHHP